jgi:putative membrane protein
MSLIIHLVLVALALMGAAYLIPGIAISSFLAALIAAIVLGLLNIFVRPVLILLTLPVTILTLGLFVFVINGLLFWAAASFLDGFSVSGFVPAFLGALFVSVVSAFVGKLLT